MKMIISISLSLLLFFSFSVSATAEIIIFKSGNKIEAKIIERTDRYIKVEFEGVTLTCFLDEIESIDGNRPVIISIKKEEPPVKETEIYYLKKGIDYVLENKFNEAEEEFKKGLKLNSSTTDCERNLKIISDLKKGLINEDFAVCLFKGMKHGFNNQDLEALNEYEKALKKNPHYSYAYTELGISYSKLDQKESAINSYKKSIDLDSNNYIAYNLLGGIYLSIGEYQQAKTCFSKAKEINPGYAVTYLNLSDTYRSLGQEQAAINYLLKSLEINSNVSGIAYRKLGIIYVGLGQYREAAIYLQKAIEISPDDDLSYYNFGYLYLLMEQFQQAITYLQKAVEINPDFAEAYCNLGLAYAGLGQQEKAITYYQKAIEVKSNYDKAYLNIANAYIAVGQYQEAINNLQKVIEINPNLAETYNSLSIAYDALNQHKEAKKNLQKARKLSQKNYKNSVPLLSAGPKIGEGKIIFYESPYKYQKDVPGPLGGHIDEAASFSFGYYYRPSCREIIEKNTKINNESTLSLLTTIYSPLSEILWIDPFPGAQLFLPSLISLIAILSCIFMFFVFKGWSKIAIVFLAIYLIIGFIILRL